MTITRRDMIRNVLSWGAFLGIGGFAVKDSLDRPPVDPAFPDRVSLDEHSPYYDRYIDTSRLGVTLDGVDQKECVEACQSEGWVRVFRIGNDGKLLTRRDAVLTERRYGVVRFYNIAS
jgi:hypothetical protein